MSCPYVIIKSYAETPICTNTNKECLYFRRCNTQIKWLASENINKCPERNKQDRSIPPNSYYVRFVKNGYAYVEIGADIVKVLYKGEKVQYLFLDFENGEYKVKNS